MTTLNYPFTAFPFFDRGRRPILVKGKALCRLISVTPRPNGESGILRWQVTHVQVSDPKEGADIAYTQDRAFRQDFDRWLRGKHSYAIEAELRKRINDHDENESESTA